MLGYVGGWPKGTGVAGYQVVPHAGDGWGLAMRQVLSDAALREDLAARGPVQAARFSWEETARRTLAVYQTVARR